MTTVKASHGCSGFDLVNTVLSRDEGIEKLIGLAERRECEWLEFKAAMRSRPEDLKEDETVGDFYWNVAKAVIAMANNKGGAVLVGISEKFGQVDEVVGMAAGYEPNPIEVLGIEGFLRREIEAKICPTNTPPSWETSKGNWKLGRPFFAGEVIIKTYRYQGKDIAAILVRPVGEGELLLAKHGKEECLLVRSTGDVAKVTTLKGFEAFQRHTKTRRIEDESFEQLRRKYSAPINETPPEIGQLGERRSAGHKIIIGGFVIFALTCLLIAKLKFVGDVEKTAERVQQSTRALIEPKESTKQAITPTVRKESTEDAPPPKPTVIISKDFDQF